MKINHVAKHGEVFEVQRLASECYACGDYRSYAFLWISFAQRAWASDCSVIGGEDNYFTVGEIYERGIGVPVDYQEAMKWYQRAAYPSGPCVVDPEGIYKMGYFYEHGLGVPRDISQAKTLYDMARRYGSQKAKEALDRLG